MKQPMCPQNWARRMVFGRGQTVDQLAIVGEQQHAGRVFIEPADRLHIATILILDRAIMAK